tara:strand:+ start:771 stop:1001 length:231 start_codon:yes stop_codon:yes gene_type:complete
MAEDNIEREMNSELYNYKDKIKPIDKTSHINKVVPNNEADNIDLNNNDLNNNDIKKLFTNNTGNYISHSKKIEKCS